MSEAKYKVGQELQTNEGDRHIVEEIRHRYVVRRTHAEPVKGVRLTVGAINEYREEDLTPYVRPLAVGDRVRCKADHAYSGVIDAIRDGKACLWRSYMAWDTMQIQYLERIPPEAGK